VQFLVPCHIVLSDKEISSMNSAKAEVTNLLEQLPDDTSLEDIQYHLYVLEKVKRGVSRAESKGAIMHDEVKERLGRWLDA
jgi:hypothetical protein